MKTTVPVWKEVALELKMQLIYGGGNNRTSLKGNFLRDDNTVNTKSEKELPKRWQYS